MTEYIQVLTTVEGKEAAQGIAELLVERRLAACAQVLGPIRSVYWWEGKLERAEEWLILAKSRRELYPKIEEAILARHPYSVPEIIAMPIVAGNPDYLEWLSRETS
jgi:periplasmic divalent cation tolerance protein